MGENTKLLFLKEHINWGAEKVDDFLKFKNVILEAVDRPAAKFTFRQLNKVVSPYIPDEYKPQIQGALTSVINKEYPDAVKDAIDLINELIEDIEKLPDVIKELAKGLLEIIKAAIVSMIEK